MNLEEENDSYFLSIVVSLLIFSFLLYILRKYIKGKQFTENTKATDKVIIITGANTGIGKQLSRELNIRKGKVYMFCRDEKKAFEAKVSLTKYGCDSTRFITIKCDLTSISSIKNAVEEFKKHENHLDILINNAGVMFVPKFKLTEDNCELTWQSNYLGHFILTELVLPLLEKSSGGRIINVSSYLHEHCHDINLEKINDKSYFGSLKSYNMSKLAQVLHAKELTRRIREKNALSKITINSCEPGVVNTDLLRHTFLKYDIISTIVKPFKWFFFKTAQDGAQCPLYLALSTTVDSISGKHFNDLTEKTVINKLANDKDLCKELYDYSLQYVN
ncbi:Dehydrogenase/reductase SDR family member on chromosome X [Strongyloides ratti]|uniref:Dehydrogenase/reductase SDR family member on chromosome X n=1 Tax=Strongyloides ratti TaxID=34506 RepID=A0A090KWS2_STRRB|nr:Dehydrogenase/reductase SDR family member on chromosome X [Strongyloides ratti]CEF60307.1 Dehydrogenase/reductase SDR family member on chromosome X [Strongyloides ratti]